MVPTTAIRKPAGPFRLRDLKDGNYQIHSTRGAFEGPKEMILRKTLELGIISTELEFAIGDMYRRDHNTAEFGVCGTFIYSHNDSKRQVA